MGHRLPLRHLLSGVVGAAGLSLALASCGGTSAGHPEYRAQTDAIVTSDGTQQFPVPANGRAVLAQRLTQLVPGPITDARVSNGWRTAAAAKQHAEDYAACVSAGPHIFMIVTNGSSTGDVISGPKAAERCGDSARVRQWSTLPEAMANG